MKKTLALVVVTLLPSNLALGQTTFQLPSGKIMCMWLPAGEGPGKLESLECQVFDPKYPTPPLRPQDKKANDLPSNAKACDQGFPHGDYIWLRPNSEAVWACHSEPVVPLDGHFTLAYGKTWKKGTMTCTSSTSGVTCRNKTGHGFELSRSRYKLY